MKIAVAFLSVIALAFGGTVPRTTDDRIVGGKATTIEEHPYQVSFRFDGKHNCGGSIVNADTIVTAAHCIVGYPHERLTVMVGHTLHKEGEDLKLVKIETHPDYFKGAAYNNDIGILKLAEPLTFSDKVQPIPLQPANTPVPAGTTAIVSGWGSTIATRSAVSPDELRSVDVAILTNAQCENMYGGDQIAEQMLCAQTAGHDSCQGDSGGPLVANGHLVGVVSWGYGCASPLWPGVYANVSALHEFVDQYL